MHDPGSRESCFSVSNRTSQEYEGSTPIIWTETPQFHQLGKPSIREKYELLMLYFGTNRYETVVSEVFPLFQKHEIN